MRKKSNIETFSFLNVKFKDNKSTIINHIFYLISLSFFCKILFTLLCIFIFGITIDYFDIRNYIAHGILVTSGNIPYISFTYEYGILSLIPMVISVIVSNILNIQYAIPIFQLLMICCDIITVLCVYLITLKLYNEKLAYYAGLLYIISLSSLYTTITRYDALPVCLLMLSILLFIYHDSYKSYITTTIGFFTKVFPIITLPFFIIYDIKNNLFKIKNYVIPFIIFMICIIPFIILGGLKTLNPYLFATGSSLKFEYVNTFGYTIYSWVHYVIGIDISYVSITTMLSLIMVISIGYILYYVYSLKQFGYKDMIKYIFISLCILIICAKFHSPQYFMWITPMAVILSVDKIEKIFVFIIFQIITFIEFPIMFGSFYTNIQYTNNIGNYGWYLTIFFFLIEYIILIILIIMCIRE